MQRSMYPINGVGVSHLRLLDRLEEELACRFLIRRDHTDTTNAVLTFKFEILEKSDLFHLVRLCTLHTFLAERSGGALI